MLRMKEQKQPDSQSSTTGKKKKGKEGLWLATLHGQKRANSKVKYGRKAHVPSNTYD